MLSVYIRWQKWNEILLTYKNRVVDWDVGTLLRMDCNKEFSEENTILGLNFKGNYYLSNDIKFIDITWKIIIQFIVNQFYSKGGCCKQCLQAIFTDCWLITVWHSSHSLLEILFQRKFRFWIVFNYQIDQN